MDTTWNMSQGEVMDLLQAVEWVQAPEGASDKGGKL